MEVRRRLPRNLSELCQCMPYTCVDSLRDCSYHRPLVYQLGTRIAVELHLRISPQRDMVKTRLHMVLRASAFLLNFSLLRKK